MLFLKSTIFHFMQLFLKRCKSLPDWYKELFGLIKSFQIAENQHAVLKRCFRSQGLLKLSIYAFLRPTILYLGMI